MLSVTPFDRGRAKIKALLSRNSFNGDSNSTKALATLATAARSLVRETALKWVTFDAIYVTEVDAGDFEFDQASLHLNSFFRTQEREAWGRGYST